MTGTNPLDAALRAGFSPSLKRIALAILRDEAKADDVLQEAWLMTRTFKPSEFQDERAWLAGVVRNLSRNALRKEQALQRREREASHPERQESTFAIVARAAVLEHLKAALGRLPEQERAALELHFLEGLELKQVSARLARPVPTLKHAIRRGLDQLRRELRSELGESRAWSLGLIAAFDWEPDEVHAALASSTAGASVAWMALGSACALAVVIGLALWLNGTSSGAGSRIAPQAAMTAQLPQTNRVVSTGEAALRSELASEASEAHPSSAAQPKETTEVVEASADARIECTVEVEVVNAFGTPIAGAPVYLFETAFKDQHDVGFSIHPTDEQGRVRIRVDDRNSLVEVNIGRCVLIAVRAQGFAGSEGYWLPLEGEQDLKTRVELSDPEVVLEGRATDAAGVPIPGATVGLMSIPRRDNSWSGGAMKMPLDDPRESPDDQGHFRFQYVRSGTYDLYVHAPGRGMARKRVTLPESGLVQHDIVLAEGALLRGRLVDASGMPIQGALLSFHLVEEQRLEAPELCRTRSDESGAFELPCFASVPTELEAQFMEQSDDVRSSALMLRLREFEPRPGLNLLGDIALATTRAQAFAVVDPAGAPLPGVRFAVQAPDGSFTVIATTNGEGRVQFDLPVEATNLIARMRLRENVLWIPDQSVLLGALTGEEVRVVFEPKLKGSIEGSLGSQGWKLPPQLKLTAMHVESRASADFDLPEDGGAFSLQQIPTGAYEAWLHARSSLYWSLGRFDVPSGAAFDLGQVVLPAPGAASFDWRVASEDSEPGALRLRVLQPNGWVVWQSTALREQPLDLMPGDYVLEVTVPGSSPRSWSFRIESGVERWVTVEL